MRIILHGFRVSCPCNLVVRVYIKDSIQIPCNFCVKFDKIYKLFSTNFLHIYVLDFFWFGSVGIFKYT